MKILSLATLALLFAACATEPAPRPDPVAIDYANHLQSCDPAFASELDAFTSGRSDVEPAPSIACNLGEGLAEAGGCGFASWWNWAGTSEHAACIAIGLPLCYATICVAGSL